MSKVLDTISATNVGGRNGKGTSSDGKVEIQFSLAKALGGKGEGATPEHLFALGYSACFASAMQYVAGQKKIHLPPDFSITAKVDLTQTDAQQFQLAVELVAKADGVEKSQLEELLKISDTVCPYSRAIKGNVDVKLSVA
jgi:osmotically inducible protein OsmC